MIEPDPIVLRFIDTYENFIVIGHQDPDGDCICSSVALASILNRYGKKAVAYNDGPFIRTDITKYLKDLVPEIEEGWYATNGNNALIIVDCSSLERLGHNGPNFEGVPTLIIDHHASSEDYGDVRYVDSHSPSCTLLIHRVAKALGMKLTQNEAQTLFYGFCTDTGYFRHLNQDHFLDVAQASELMEAGADPKAAYQQMSRGKSLNMFHLLADLMQRVEFFNNGEVAFVYDTKEDIEKYGKEASNADALYGQLFSVDGVEAIVYLKYKEDGVYTIGFRAVSKINVGQIAQELGGGGHKLAAGAKINGSVADIKAMLLEKLQDPQYRL